MAIVDDDAAVLASLEFLLRASGYDVIAYGAPSDFLDDASIQDGSLRATCVIVDQQMPGMTGLEFIARLRRDGRGMPALLISSASSSAVRAQASELGVAFISKPLKEEELLRFVAAHAGPADA